METDTIVRCPWCGRPARNDVFDTPVGTVTGHYWCEHCDTHDILGNLNDEVFASTLYPDEIETGWYRPSELADTPLRFTRIGTQYEEEEIPF
jgi:hypothetical protein